LAPTPNPRHGATVTDGSPSADAGKGDAVAQVKPSSPNATTILANSAAIGVAQTAVANAALANNTAQVLVQAGAAVPGQPNANNTGLAVLPNGVAPLNLNNGNVGALNAADDLGASGALTGLRVQSPISAAQSRSGQRVLAEFEDARGAAVAAAASAAAQVDLVEVTQVTGLALTAGTIWWALRAGGLLAGLVVTLPAWRHADLLAVLPDAEDDEGWDPAEGADSAEDDEAARDEHAVRQMLEPAAEREHS
jgi:hypothetical protein